MKDGKLQKSMMKLLVSIFLGQLHLPRIVGIELKEKMLELGLLCQFKKNLIFEFLI